MTGEEFCGRLQKVKHQRGYWIALCPAHEDRSPSLSVRDIDGNVAVKCFAGCTTTEITAAVGLTVGDLLEDQDDRAKILDEYDYFGLDGELCYQVVRYVPKAFKQRRPDPAGGWIWDLKGTERIPYRLPELTEAVASGRWVFVCEGERDVWTLTEEGFAATTFPGGAGKWDDSYARWFTGALVAVLPDNDTPGREHAAAVAEALEATAAEVRIVTLDGLPEKGDVTDWMGKHTAEDLRQAVGVAPSFGDDQKGEITASAHTVTATYPTLAVTAEVTRLHWEGGQIHGEISIRQGRRTLVQYQRVNTQSASARRELITELRRWDEEASWHEIINPLFAAAVKAHRTVGRLEDMRGRPDPGKPSFLVGDYWPDMTRPSLLFGDGESAKSTISLALLLSVASGRSLLGDDAHPTRRGPVAYLDYEDDEDLFAHRLAAFARGNDLDLGACDPIHYYHPDAALGHLAESLAEQMRREGTVACVIDSRSGAQSGSLVNDDDTRVFIDAVVTLGARAWIIDHLDKESTKARTAPKHSYGSVFLRNRVASSWMTKTVSNGGGSITVNLTDRKWNHGPVRPEHSLVVDWTDGIRIDRRGAVRTPTVDESSTASEMILAYLTEERSASLADLVRELDLKRDTVRKALQRGKDTLFLQYGDAEIWSIHPAADNLADTY